MSFEKKISSDILVTTIVRLATQIRGLVFIPLVSKFLGIAAYGAYIQLLAVTGLLSLIAEFGLHAALVRYAQEGNRDTGELYYSLTTFALLSGVAFSVVVFVLAPLVAQLTLGSNQYSSIFRLGALLIPLKIIASMSGNYFRSEMRVKTFSIIEGTKEYVSIGIVLIALIELQLGLFGVVASIVLTEAAFAVIVQYMIGKRIGYMMPTFTGIQRYLKYSIPLTTSIIASDISSRADRLLIGFFLGASAVGIYSVSYSIASFLMIYVQPVLTSVFPELSRLLEENKERECSTIIRSGVRYFIILSVPSVVGLYLLGPNVISVIAGDQASNASVFLLPLVACGILFWGLDELYGIILVAGERTITLSLIRGGAAVTNATLNVVLVPWLHIEGAAIATLFSYALSAFIVYIASNTTVPADFNSKTLLNTVVSSLVMLFLVRFLLTGRFIRTLVLAPIVYFTILIALREIRLAEIRHLLSR